MKNSTLQLLGMLIVLFAFQAFISSSWAQVPQKMSYQAVIRNSSDKLIVNKSVGMRIGILQGSEAEIAVYTETQTPTTNINGLVTVEIGTGTSNDDFSAIDWANGPYFIKTETDVSGGTDYTITSLSQLLSVPYSLYSKTAENGFSLPLSKSTSVASPALVITNTLGNAIRGISNGSGTGVFGENTSDIGSTTGVYGKTVSATGFGVHGSSPFVGVRGWSDTIAGLSYGVLGFAESPEGYAVYGRNMATSGSSIGVLGKSDSPDGYGVYGSSPDIAVKGNSTGTKGTGVAGSGARIGVSGTASATTGTGAYAISGETQSPIGYGVYGGSYSNTGTTYGIYGKVNSPDGFSGYFDGGKFFTNSKIGVGTTTPEFDIDVNKTAGSSTLRLKSASSGALIILDQVNNFNNNFSFIIFRKAGVNAFMTGMNYDEYEILSSSNSKGLTVSKDGYVRISERLHLNDGGRIGIGTSSPGAALHIKATGYPNSFIYLESATGNDAGFRLYEGETAKWHIYNVSGASGLNICNSNFTTAIFAKQSNSYVGINTTTPNYNLEVNGTAGKTGGGSWSNSSDIRLKNVLGNYQKGLSEIAALQPILFKYKEGNARNLPSTEEQIGFVAQDVQKVFPEAVTKAEDGYLDFNIHAINVALVNAVKELKAENDKLKAENELLKSKNEQIDSRLTTLEKIISASAMK